MPTIVFRQDLRGNWGRYPDHLAASVDRPVITRHVRPTVARVPRDGLKALKPTKTEPGHSTNHT